MLELQFSLFAQKVEISDFSRARQLLSHVARESREQMNF